MRVHFTEDGWEDYLSWKDDNVIFAAVSDLINEIRRSPFTGTGKPEPLKAKWRGWWSRRITQEHRLVYAVSGKLGPDQHVTIAKCRDHY